jgi:type I restriction enzyme, R subunit
MPHAYTEVQLVAQPAIGSFAELGWTTVLALEGIFGATGALLRETKGEVVLASRLIAALVRLNLALPRGGSVCANLPQIVRRGRGSG